MAFWSDASGAEPKRNYRWIVTFRGSNPLLTNVNGMSYALKKVDKPKAKIAETTHKYLNHFFYYPGRLEWEAINMTFASVTGPDDTTRLMDAVTRLSGYGVPVAHSVGNQSATLGKRKFNSVLGNTIDISQLDADGNIIENWELNNPFFTNVQYGTLDYGSEDIVEISTTVRYDWAQLSFSNSEPTETVGVRPTKF